MSRAKNWQENFESKVTSESKTVSRPSDIALLAGGCTQAIKQ